MGSYIKTWILGVELIINISANVCWRCETWKCFLFSSPASGGNLSKAERCVCFVAHVSRIASFGGERLHVSLLSFPAVQWGEDGRPFHFLFYTGKQSYYSLMHVSPADSCQLLMWGGAKSSSSSNPLVLPLAASSCTLGLYPKQRQILCWIQRGQSGVKGRLGSRNTWTYLRWWSLFIQCQSDVNIPSVSLTLLAVKGNVWKSDWTKTSCIARQHQTNLLIKSNDSVFERPADDLWEH